MAVEVVGCEGPVCDAFATVEVYGEPALRLILQLDTDHACATAFTLPVDAVRHIGDRAVGFDGVALPELEEREVVPDPRDECRIPGCRRADEETQLHRARIVDRSCIQPTLMGYPVEIRMQECVLGAVRTLVSLDQIAPLADGDQVERIYTQRGRGSSA